MTYSSHYTNRASIFEYGDIIAGSHVKSIYDELGATPGDTLAAVSGISDSVDGLGVPYMAGAWFNACGTEGADTGLSFNQLFLWPMVLSHDVTFDRISAYVVIAGSAGTVVRLGIYESDADGMPSALVSGSDVTQNGTVVNTATVAGSTINVSLTRGRYYLAAVSQGSTTSPTVITGRIPKFPINSAASTNFTNIMREGDGCLQRIASTSGALPSTIATSDLTLAATGHAVAVRMV